MINCKTLLEARNVENVTNIVMLDDGTFNAYEKSDNYIAPEIAQTKIINVDEFRNRFSDTTIAGILSAAYSGDSNCQILLLKLQTSQAIDLLSKTVTDGIDYLVSKNLMTVDEKAAVLA